MGPGAELAWVMEGWCHHYKGGGGQGNQPYRERDNQAIRRKVKQCKSYSGQNSQMGWAMEWAFQFCFHNLQAGSCCGCGVGVYLDLNIYCCLYLYICFNLLTKELFKTQFYSSQVNTNTTRWLRDTNWITVQVKAISKKGKEEFGLWHLVCH